MPGMTNSNAKSITRNSKLIKAPAEEVYQAFTNPEALIIWQAPGEMSAKVHDFDLRIGGGYTMSLFYPQSEESRGKTSEREDRFTAQFLELTPHTSIVEAISFDSDDPAFSGKMFMVVTFAQLDDGTEVTIVFENIPLGISPADNEAGTQSSLEKLEQYCNGR